MTVYRTEIDDIFVDRKDPKKSRRIRIKGTITLDKDAYSTTDLQAFDVTDPKNPVPANDLLAGDRLSETIDIGRKLAIDEEQRLIQAQNGNTVGTCSNCLRWGKVPQPGGSFLCVKCGTPPSSSLRVWC